MRAGPLEATIRNVQRELQTKEVEGKELQRHWIVLQTELVARQNENGKLTESQARLASSFSILYQKKVALEHELGREQAQVRWLNAPLATLRASCPTHAAIAQKPAAFTGTPTAQPPCTCCRRPDWYICAAVCRRRTLSASSHVTRMT